ncbi:MAG: deoxycytidylate deaminase, partial [Bacteroidota bacterium]
MGVALLSARRSKDPGTQVGACIVNPQHKIVGAGYNGLPAGCNDDEFPWDKQGGFLDTKYAYVCHAELNAILNNIGMSLQGCRIYTALFPCNECAKAIIQSGIK